MATKSEWSWAAGLFEGEGTIGTYPTKRTVNRRIQLSSTDKDVIEKFGAVVGVGTMYGPQRRAGCKDLYTWSISNYKEVVKVATHFTPWLGKRRIQAVEKFISELPEGSKPAMPKERPLKINGKFSRQSFMRCMGYRKHRFSYRGERLADCLRCGAPNPY